MRTVIKEKYGDYQVLKLKERPIPVPNEKQVLIKVRASTINAYDVHLVKGDPFPVRMTAGLCRPKNNQLGCDLAGVIENIGSKVTKFKKGDEVFTCLADGNGDDAYSDYVCVNEELLTLKPRGISHEEAATIPMAGLTALQSVRDFGKIQPGQKVLINGATGGVGSFAVQIAKLFGGIVTAVCRTEKEEFAYSIGADYFIDYTKENLITSREKYDLIIDVVGNHAFSEYKKVLNEKGTCVMVGFSSISHMIKVGWDIFRTRNKQQKIVLSFAKNSQVEDLEFLAEKMNDKKINAIIDQTFSLSDIQQAFQYFEAEHLNGKVVISE
ncbi:NAD(P)-dependent alcohol dehydrogenase [Enterococcus sp. DIV0756]|uniref:NAD(P)-dependent alcohol dehydrogenase n=1 Tax=Enterococcus sp. DIV0756 TaxID=2774636 RepID=UPI003F2451F4